MGKKLISIVVPCYNEEPTLHILYEELSWIKMVSYVESREYDNAATRRVSRKGEPIIRNFLHACFIE